MERWKTERERDVSIPVVSKAISTMAVSVSEAARWNTENMFFQPDLHVAPGRKMEFIFTIHPASHAIYINAACTPLSYV